jgi:hypothetical protein
LGDHASRTSDDCPLVVDSGSSGLSDLALLPSD